MAKEYKFKNLHVFNDPKFSSGFFDFLIRNNVDLKDDNLFHYRQNKHTGKCYGMSAIFAPNFFSIIPNLRLLNRLFHSKKIILHSLASPYLLIYLWLFPSLGKKTFWVIWGKDLYFYHTLEKKRLYHRVYEFFRKLAIKKIKHIITFTKGDYDLALKWYGCDADWYQSFMYTSNLYKDIECTKNQQTDIIILVGNSADPSNHHEEIFGVLESFKNEAIQIIAPLSYGDKSYAQTVMAMGKKKFGEKFIALEQLLPINEYNKLLANVDIGIFAHKRQQAMGNIISLLGMKKTVYLRNTITSWDTLSSLGIELKRLDNFDLNEQENSVREQNSTIIKDVYSEKNLLSQWLEIENQDPLSKKIPLENPPF